MNRKIIRLSESELQGIMHKCVEKALRHKLAMNESMSYSNELREVQLAQKSLCKFALSDVMLRLEHTKFRGEAQKMRDAIVDLNNNLIDFIRTNR
jgi:hypothetical protein